MRYRKRPVEVEARQFTDNASAEAILKWSGSPPIWPNFHPGDHPEYGNGEVAILVIETLEGNMRADKGDWIIKGVQGEFYPCKPDIFEATYEEVQ